MRDGTARLVRLRQNFFQSPKLALSVLKDSVKNLLVLSNKTAVVSWVCLEMLLSKFLLI